MSAHPPKSTHKIIAKADSGASKHYIRDRDKAVLTNIISTAGPKILLPDKSVLQATSKGMLPLPTLSKESCVAHVIPGLKSSSLLSMGQLCDDNCEIQLRKHDMVVRKNNHIILHGTRNTNDGLWDIDLQHPLHNTEITNHKLNVIVDTKSISDLIAYYHGCVFSPSKSTWLKAIEQNNFVTWPGLTAERVRQFYPETSATAKGHLDQEHKNLRSTKPAIIPLSPSELDNALQDSFPAQDTLKPTHQIMSLILPFHQPSKAYCDLTGKFPFKSSRGNQYIMVFYNYDANYINAIAIRSRQAAEIKNAFVTHTQTLQQSGVTPDMFILDNEISNDFKNALNKYTITYQLVPPAQHRRNAAERAIRTFKNHFIAGLASLPAAFPITEWDRLLPQALLTLNLLRNSRLNPKLSAHSFVHGIHDFNKNPLAPPGTRVVAHEKPLHRKTWDIHGKEGWYVGPAIEHYRCVRVYLPDTHQERVCDTVKFLPEKFPFHESQQQIILPWLRKTS